MSPDHASTDGAAPPPLFLVRGEATAEEVAALTVVLQSVAAANAAPPERRVRSEWSSHHRKMRPSVHAGPGGWRSSGLPH